MEKRSGLLLSASRIWLISLPFRLVCHPNNPGFSPGLRNLITYEAGKLWHWCYERERLVYWADRIRSLWSSRLP
jgi:hypothetical protein